MKKVVLVGGSGEIGSILRKGLNETYQIIVMDKQKCVPPYDHFIEVDVLDYERFVSLIPPKTDVIINLLSIPVDDGIVSLETMNLMVDVFLKATYHIYYAAVELNIQKVINSSSNHVTDFYEQDGYSQLSRKIQVNDYPYSKGLYGTLKLASENIGHSFSVKYENLSVINLRIGTVRQDQKTILMNNNRAKRTLLSNSDAINLYKCSVESGIKYGTYYGVSNNEGAIWDTGNARKELGFIAVDTTDDLLKKLNY